VDKAYERWHSPRIDEPIGMARWGHHGTPVLVFPTAGGDAEEIERHGILTACQHLIDSGRVKVYSCDSVAGRAMTTKAGSVEWRMWLLNRFFDAVREEVVPAIWADSRAELPIICAGASIGAFNSVALLCRSPDLVRAAVAMSGSYHIERFYDGAWSPDLYFAAPMQFVPGMDGAMLDHLRTRFAVLATGSGAWEAPEESWEMAHVLGGRGVPNRVDDWGPAWEHDWHTWRRMLPQYLEELT
jgi:esterase/lipase superfamily enzyme